VAVFIYLLFVNLLQTALMWGGTTFFPTLVEAEWFQWILQIVPGYLLGFPLVALLLTGLPKEKPEKKKMNASGWVGFLAISFFMTTAGSLISNLLITRMEVFKGAEISDTITQQISEFSPLTTLLVVVIAGPIFEELIFRKLLLDRLLPYSEAFAILTGGLLFGLLHGNFYQFFYSTMLGILFSFIYVRTGRISYSILMHIIINFTGAIIAPFISEHLANSDATGSIDLWGMVTGVYSTATYVLAICGAVLLIFGLKKMKVSTQGSRGLTLSRQFRLGWLNVGMLLTGGFCLISFIISILI
jgi:membrane protease YdiL (CAAX protease family)